MWRCSNHCAQRQKASKVCRGSVGQSNFWLSLVLNAKRHQRYVQLIFPNSLNPAGVQCSTPKGIKGMSSGCLSRVKKRGRMCSTPKDIKGMSSSPKGRRTTREVPRSTPKGIKGMSRNRAGSPGCRYEKCSTPKGIKGMSRSVCRWESKSIRCSTPKGIKGMSRAYCPLFGRYGCRRAQRQKASKVCPVLG